jgi:hypothetical protein
MPDEIKAELEVVETVVRRGKGMRAVMFVEIKAELEVVETVVRRGKGMRAVMFVEEGQSIAEKVDLVGYARKAVPKGMSARVTVTARVELHDGPLASWVDNPLDEFGDL